MRPAALLLLALASAPSLTGQATCWRPQSPAVCRHYVVTDFAIGYWLNPTSSRFDGNRSRITMAGEFGYLRAVGDRTAIGGTVGATYYNRRSRYAGIEWLYPDAAAHALARVDHWVTERVAVRAGVGTPIAGGRMGATVDGPGLDVELGVRTAGRLGAFVRMERQRLNEQGFGSPDLPGLNLPVSGPGQLTFETSFVRTDWFAGVTTSGWPGLTGFGAISLLAFFSALTFSS